MKKIALFIPIFISNVITFSFEKLSQIQVLVPIYYNIPLNISGIHITYGM